MAKYKELFFNGVQLTKCCALCHGEGEIVPTAEQRKVCPGCGKTVEPLDVARDENGVVRDDVSSGPNPLTCPECGQRGDYQDFGLEAVWCADCEGTGRNLTPAGYELVAFIREMRSR